MNKAHPKISAAEAPYMLSDFGELFMHINTIYERRSDDVLKVPFSATQTFRVEGIGVFQVGPLRTKPDTEKLGNKYFVRNESNICMLSDIILGKLKKRGEVVFGFGATDRHRCWIRISRVIAGERQVEDFIEAVKRNAEDNLSTNGEGKNK